MSEMNWNYCNEKLPKKGKRVIVLVQKEMIYQGNEDEKSSEWIDDFQGERGIVSWRDFDNE